MVVHEAVGMTDPPETIDHATETFQESLSILVIEEDVQRIRVLQELQGTRDYEFPALIPRLVIWYSAFSNWTRSGRAMRRV